MAQNDTANLSATLATIEQKVNGHLTQLFGSPASFEDEHERILHVIKHKTGIHALLSYAMFALLVGLIFMHMKAPSPLNNPYYYGLLCIPLLISAKWKNSTRERELNALKQRLAPRMLGAMVDEASYEINGILPMVLGTSFGLQDPAVKDYLHGSYQDVAFEMFYTVPRGRLFTQSPQDGVILIHINAPFKGETAVCYYNPEKTSPQTIRALGEKNLQQVPLSPPFSDMFTLHTTNSREAASFVRSAFLASIQKLAQSLDKPMILCRFYQQKCVLEIPLRAKRNAFYGVRGLLNLSLFSPTNDWQTELKILSAQMLAVLRVIDCLKK